MFCSIRFSLCTPGCRTPLSVLAQVAEAAAPWLAGWGEGAGDWAEPGAWSAYSRPLGRNVVREACTEVWADEIDTQISQGTQRLSSTTAPLVRPNKIRTKPARTGGRARRASKLQASGTRWNGCLARRACRPLSADMRYLTPILLRSTRMVCHTVRVSRFCS